MKVLMFVSVIAVAASARERPPKFTKTPNQFVTAPEYESFRLVCKVKGNPKPHVTWYHNGEIISEKTDQRFSIKHKYLHIKYLRLSDSGQYACLAKNHLGFAWGNTTLNVEERRLPIAPMIKGPKNQTVAENDDAVFTCEVIGSYTLTRLRWLKHYKVNGSFTDEKGGPYVKTLQDSGRSGDAQRRLVLKNVTRDDEGWYTCLAANQVGMNYVSAWLTVTDAYGVNGKAQCPTGLEQHGNFCCQPMKDLKED